MNDEKEWGNYPPQKLHRLLMFLTELGLGRGLVKNLLIKIWRLTDHEGVVDIVYNDLKLRLFSSGSTLDSKILFSSKIREKDEINFLKSRLSSSSIMVDLGANSGYYSLHAAKFGASKILAVEANILLCNRINFHVHTNGFNSKVVTYNLAVGKANGSAKLALQDGDQGSNFIIRDTNMNNPSFMEVEMMSLLSIVKKSGVSKINVLKIDIEGMEEDVLTSFFSNADKSLWPKSIIMETVKSNLWKSDLEEFLQELSYKIIARTRSNTMLDLV